MQKNRPGSGEAWNESYDEWTSRIWRKILKGVTLFLIITAGVTCGNLTSNYISASVAGIIAERELREMAEKAEEAARRAAAENEARKERLAKEWAERNRKAEERRREQQKQQEIQEQRRSTCMYWIDQYRKTGKELDKLHRNRSCRDAGISVN